MKELVFYTLYEPFTEEDEQAIKRLADSIEDNNFLWKEYETDENGREYVRLCFDVDDYNVDKFYENGFEI